MSNLLNNKSSYALDIIVDNYYINGFLYLDMDILVSKKIVMPKDFFHPLFERDKFLQSFISNISKAYETYITYSGSLKKTIYSTMYNFEKDFLKVVDNFYHIDQRFINEKASYFSRKIDTDIFVINLSRDRIFLSGSNGYNGEIQEFSDPYFDIFSIKKISEFPLIQSKIRKSQLYNSIIRPSLDSKDLTYLAISSLLIAHSFSSFNIAPGDTIPAIVLSGDIYEVLKNASLSIFSLLFGSSLPGVVSLFLDNSYMFPMLSILPDDDVMGNILKIADIFFVRFEGNTKDYVFLKIVDENGIKEEKIKFGDIVNIPINLKSHITINLPHKCFIGTKSGTIEFIASNNVVIDTRSGMMDTSNHLKEWLEGFDPLSF